MIENDRECPELLIEISAVKSALDSLSKVITQNYTYECIRDVSSGREEKLESLLKAIFKYH